MQCPGKDPNGFAMMLDYVSGRLEADALARFERHLGECSRCRERLEAQIRLSEALDEWRPEPVSAEFDERLYARVAEAEAARRWWRRLAPPAFHVSLRPAMAVGAACLVLIAVLLVRLPVSPTTGTAASSDPVNIEQVEQAIEDLDMLYLLDPASLDEPAGGETAPAKATGVAMRQAGRTRCG